MADPRFLEADGCSTVVVERTYPHPIDRVWRAVTTPEHLGQWFPSGVELDLRPGGAMRFAAFEGSPAAIGTVEAVDPPRRLTFTWGNDRMAFDLAPSADGSGTTLTLTHTFDDGLRTGAASFATGWEVCLGGLRAVLADEPRPAPDRGIDRHEELVVAFGLDQPAVVEDGDGRWTVRWERQLTCPAEVAWDLWFGTDGETGEQRSAPAVGEGLRPYGAPDLVVGIVTEMTPCEVLAFDVTPEGGPGEHVRWELGEGTGHGVRIVLTVRGAEADDLAAAIEMWGDGAVRHLAERAADWAKASIG